MPVETEKEVAAYLQATNKRLYDRLFLNKTIAGTITNVSGTRPLWLVRLDSTGDAWHACYEPGYTPAIGGVVDLTWRDADTGYVMTPRSSGALVASYSPIGPPVILTASLGAITFASIPQSFNILYLSGRFGCDNAAVQLIRIQFNDDVSASYNSELLQGNEGVAAAANVANNATSGAIGMSSGTGYQSYTACSAEIPGYNQLIPVLMSSRNARQDLNGPTGRMVDIYTTGWVVSPRQAITKIKLFPATGNWAAGTTAYLYGA